MGLVIDLDTTLVNVRSEKEQARPTLKNGFGHHPLCAFLDHGRAGTGEPLAIALRPGNAGSNTAADYIAVTKDALAHLPPGLLGRDGRRLGLACALLGDPELLILDEPTNGLDPAGMSAMRDLIREQARLGRTVMLSSHLLGEIAQVCDRIGVLHEGKLITVGTPREIEQRYAASSQLLVTCDRPEEAAAIARGLAEVESARATAEGIEVEVPADDSAALLSALVAGGISVRGMRAQERSLEDAFLQMTSTGTAGAAGASAAAGTTTKTEAAADSEAAAETEGAAR